MIEVRGCLHYSKFEKYTTKVSSSSDYANTYMHVNPNLFKRTSVSKITLQKKMHQLSRLSSSSNATCAGDKLTHTLSHRPNPNQSFKIHTSTLTKIPQYSHPKPPKKHPQISKTKTTRMGLEPTTFATGKQCAAIAPSGLSD